MFRVLKDNQYVDTDAGPLIPYFIHFLLHVLSFPVNLFIIGWKHPVS